MMVDSEPREPRSPGRGVRNWLELSLWTVVVLSLVLDWFNGPAVSSDQVFVRTTVVLVSMTCAGWLRLHTLRDV